MSSFEFNAPQFVNFSDVDDPKADRFFDVNEQEEEVKSQVSSYSMKIKETPAWNRSDSENQVPSSTVKTKETLSSRKNFKVFRKVLHEIVNRQTPSDSDISNTQSKDQKKDIVQHFENLHLTETKQKKSKGPFKATELFSGVNCQETEKKHPMITRSYSANRKSAKLSIGSMNSEDSSEHYVSSTTSNYMKPISMKRNASPLHSARKFISLAEQVEHFYKDTPDRYRSRPTKPTTPIRKTWVAKPNCVPKTPNLTTKYRQRKVNFPDEKQREEMELEEMKKHQIKAHPLNEKILMGPCLNLKAPIVKKPVTVPQPFTLTEVKKKLLQEPPPEPVFHFKAQPVPTTILNGPVGIPPRKVVSPTVPTTPQIKVPLRLRVEVKSQEKNASSDSVNFIRNTKIEPFSFDARMRDLLQKKEEFVKRVIEEEKKSFNSFKAHPMPDFKSSTPKIEKPHQKTIPQPFSLTQPKGNKLFSEEESVARLTPFKARPASVIHQKPFVPKLEKHETQFPSDFQLNTEKRAAERQKFDEKIKKKEEELAMILKLQKEEEQRLEKERMLEERKKTEFKATPMPHYKVFKIQGSDPECLTLPQSPKFSTKKQNERLNV